MSAGGDVAVVAFDDTDFTMLNLGAGGGLVGIGAGVGVLIIDKMTTAAIGNGASVDAAALGVGGGVSGVLTGDVPTTGTFSESTARGVIVQAQTSEDILNLSIAGGGGVVGIAGAVTVTVVDSDTSATIGTGAMINQNAGDYESNSVGAEQGVWVMAANKYSLVSVAGSLSVGFVGAGASVSFASSSQ